MFCSFPVKGATFTKTRKIKWIFIDFLHYETGIHSVNHWKDVLLASKAIDHQ